MLTVWPPRPDPIRRLAFIGLVASWSPALALAPKTDATEPLSTASYTAPIIDTVDGLPVIEAFIDGKGPFRFKFDSASADIMDSPSALQAGLSGDHKAEYADVAATTLIDVAPSATLGVSGAKLAGVSMWIMPASWTTNPKVSGFLGRSLLSHYTVTVDIPHGRMVLTPPDAYRPPEGATVIPMRAEGDKYAISARVDGVDGTFVVDTGAVTDVALSSAFQQTPAFKQRFPAPGQTVEISGQSGIILKGSVFLGRLLEIGDQQIADPIILLFSRDESPTFHAISGVIGLGVLRQYTVTFDVKNKRLVLSDRQPSGTLHRGIGFDTAFSDGVTRICRVVRGGPAWKAGFRDGDQLLAVDRQSVASISKTGWDRLWQEADGTRIELLTRRGDGHPRRTTIILSPWSEQF
jgi:hypothetical protein